MSCDGAIMLCGLLAAAVVTGVASGSVALTPSAQEFETSRVTTPAPGATRQIPILYDFKPGQHTRKLTFIDVSRDRTFAFFRPRDNRTRYFCLTERAHTRLLGATERAVSNLPRVVEGRPMRGTTEQYLWLWAQRTEGQVERLGYSADQETAAKPPPAIRKLIARLHRLLEAHRGDNAGIPDDDRTRCRSQPR